MVCDLQSQNLGGLCRRLRRDGPPDARSCENFDGQRPECRVYSWRRGCERQPWLLGIDSVANANRQNESLQFFPAFAQSAGTIVSLDSGDYDNGSRPVAVAVYDAPFVPSGRPPNCPISRRRP